MTLSNFFLFKKDKEYIYNIFLFRLSFQLKAKKTYELKMISPEKSTNNLISQINEQVFIKNYGCTQVRPENNSDINQIKVLSRRWIILAVFSLITLLSAFNWIEYNIIQG